MNINIAEKKRPANSGYTQVGFSAKNPACM
jgi:hypothetical protein